MVLRLQAIEEVALGAASRSGKWRNAISLLEEMEVESTRRNDPSVMPTVHTYTAVLKACAASPSLALATAPPGSCALGGCLLMSSCWMKDEHARWQRARRMASDVLYVSAR